MFLFVPCLPKIRIRTFLRCFFGGQSDLIFDGKGN